MLLLPKRVKFRKMQRGRMKGKATRGNQVHFGDFGLQALEPAWVTGRQIEAARKTLAHFLKRGGKVWIRVFPDKSVTMRAAETRMGSGKGNPEYWIAVVRPGTMLLELGGVDRAIAEEAMRLAGFKFGISTRMVVKE